MPTIPFQSTRPVRGGTDTAIKLSLHTWISIHPPRAGRDSIARLTALYISYFNPPAPCGAGLTFLPALFTHRNFNPPAPCGAGHVLLDKTANRVTFQSTRPVRGGTAIIYKHTSVIYCTIYNNAPANPTWQHILQPCGIFFFAMRIKIRCEVRGVFPGASPSHGQIIRTPSGLYPAFTPKCSVFVS